MISALISAAANLVLLAGVPFLGYTLYHKLRWKRPMKEIATRAGLARGEPRYLVYGAVFAVGAVGLLLLWGPPLDPFLRESSPQRRFVGIELDTATVMALLYGVVKTGLSEEVLFRGLVAGSLSRRLPLRWANLGQSVIFLVPHLPVAMLMPELRPFLVAVFGGSFFLGWLRIKSGSILGPWLIHAALNTATCLSVAVRTTDL